MTTLDLTADTIDIRDIIERVEELEALLGNEEGTDEGWQGTREEWDELAALQFLLSELKGNGGDEQWRGDWYPLTLISEDSFTDYIEQLIDDCYEMPKEMNSGNWPYRHITIDYEAAAEEAKQDYSEIEIDGTTYLYR